MDTGSADVALSGESVDDVIKPELRAEYEREKHAWFPRDYNDEVRAFDKRTPGYLRPNSRATELLGCVVRCIFVTTNRKLSSAVRGLISIQMRSTKTPI